MRPPVLLRQRAGHALMRAWEERGLASTALLPLAWAYGAVTAIRRGLYRHGGLASTRLPVPVVVVGNLVAGGAGKTPAVLAVVTLLERHGWHPGVVSRGYGRTGDAVLAVQPNSDAAEAGDEPLLLRRRAGVPVFVGRHRVAAAQALLLAHPEVDIVVADDGLQHLAMQRDVQIIVFDERGAGNGRLLPAGPLRERPGLPTDARTLVLYNAEAATTPLPGYTSTRRLAGIVSLAGWWRGEAATQAALQGLCGRPVAAASALARPGRFFAMLSAAGVRGPTYTLPDHDAYATLPWPSDCADVIVTEKDAVKLRPERPMSADVWVATLDFAPEPAFEAALLRALPARPSSNSN